MHCSSVCSRQRGVTVKNMKTECRMSRSLRESFWKNRNRKRAAFMQWKHRFLRSYIISLGETSYKEHTSFRILSLAWWKISSAQPELIGKILAGKCRYCTHPVFYGFWTLCRIACWKVPCYGRIALVFKACFLWESFDDQWSLKILVQICDCYLIIFKKFTVFQYI